MKTSLLKKMWVIIHGSILFTVAANAQIVYTDLNPDSTIIYTNRYHLDLNDDGVDDFTLTVSFGSARCGAECQGHRSEARVSPAGGSLNAIINDVTNYPRALDSLSVINDSASKWSASTSQILAEVNCLDCGGDYYGNWTTTDDKYLGLKLISGTNTYYGWMRLSVTVSLAYMVVSGYAYNSIPNKPIRAGETNCTTPIVTLSANGPLSFCTGDSVILTAKGTGYLYQWKKDKVNISGAIHKKYVAKTTGIYKCKVTNSCGSKTSKSDTVTISCKSLFVNTFINDEKITPVTTQLKIAPNPFSNSTTISFSLSQSQKASITIFDINGRSIKTLGNRQMQAGTHQLVWNAKDEKGNAVGSGMYLLKLQAGNYTETKKIVAVR
jgi:hypothetical protein